MRTRCITCRALIDQGSYCKAHDPWSGSTRQWRKTRERVMARDGRTCQECGAPAEHVDHILPVIAGGTDHPSNLRALCQRCNLAKGARR